MIQDKKIKEAIEKAADFHVGYVGQNRWDFKPKMCREDFNAGAEKMYNLLNGKIIELERQNADQMSGCGHCSMFKISRKEVQKLRAELECIQLNQVTT